MAINLCDLSNAKAIFIEDSSDTIYLAHSQEGG